MGASFPGYYEKPELVAQYLDFHYGPYDSSLAQWHAPHALRSFPERVAEMGVRSVEAGRWQRALDLGCAVGAAAFHLSTAFEEVIGIDFSQSFIEVCRQMVEEKKLSYARVEEGEKTSLMSAQIPPGTFPERVRFEQGDACHLRHDLGSFDLIVMANLIDRLPDPGKCLADLAFFTSPGSVVVITSPYTWLEEFTPREKWLGGTAGTLQGLKDSMSPLFDLVEIADVPFLIREHRRKYQASIAEATIWKRR